MRESKLKPSISDVFFSYYEYLTFKKRGVTKEQLAKKFSVSISTINSRIDHAYAIFRFELDKLERGKNGNEDQDSSDEHKVVKGTAYGVFSVGSNRLRTCSHAKKFFYHNTHAIFKNEYEAQSFLQELERGRKCIHCSFGVEVREISMAWWTPKTKKGKKRKNKTKRKKA